MMPYQHIMVPRAAMRLRIITILILHGRPLLSGPTRRLVPLRAQPLMSSGLSLHMIVIHHPGRVHRYSNHGLQVGEEVLYLAHGHQCLHLVSMRHLVEEWAAALAVAVDVINI